MPDRLSKWHGRAVALLGVGVWTLLNLFSVTSACHAGGSQIVDLSTRSEALVLLRGAENVRFQKTDADEELAYEVTESYPAVSALQSIKDALERRGWRPLSYDVLNPGTPSSHQRGWTVFSDGTRVPMHTVHQWAAQWKNSDGAVVFYFLEYRCDEDDRSHSRTLHIAIRLSKSEPSM